MINGTYEGAIIGVEDIKRDMDFVRAEVFDEYRDAACVIQETLPARLISTLLFGISKKRQYILTIIWQCGQSEKIVDRYCIRENTIIWLVN
jgi:hypothetical protein